MDRKIIAFWAGVLILLSLLLARSWENPLGGFFMVTCMMPIIMGVSYTLHLFLVPRFYESGEKAKFFLYLTYLFIISLYLQLWVIIAAFMYLANFDFQALAPSVQDLVQLSSTSYLISGLGFFVLQSLAKEDKPAIETIDQNIDITSNRKPLSIKASQVAYIESLNNRVYFHLNSEPPLETREKLGVLSERLPEHFIRIHRSYIINKNKITRLESDRLYLENGEEIPMGRAYKKAALQRLES